MSSIQQKIDDLQRKADLIDFCNSLISEESVFSKNLLRSNKTVIIDEVTSVVKDCLKKYILTLESDDVVEESVKLTNDDVYVLKALASRLNSKVDPKVASSIKQPMVKSEFVVPNGPSASASPQYKVDLEAKPISVGRKAMLLDSVPAFNIGGPPSSDGIPIKDKIVPDAEVFIISEHSDSFKVRQGNIQFNIPADCIQVI